MKFILSAAILVSLLLTNNVEARWKPAQGMTWNYVLGDDNFDVHKEKAQVIDVDYNKSASTIKEYHDAGKKVICYFSGGTLEKFRKDKDEYFKIKGLVRNTYGEWKDEKWVDIRKDDLKPILERRMKAAVSKNCDAIEVDNLDGFQIDDVKNWPDPLTKSDTIEFAKWLAKTAHGLGISIGLKNGLFMIDEVGSYFDFAINESCATHKSPECHYYKNFLKEGKAVFGISYESKMSSATDLCSSLNGLNISMIVKKTQELEQAGYTFNGKSQCGSSFNPGTNGKSPKPIAKKTTTIAKKTTSMARKTTVKKTTTTVKKTTTTVEKKTTIVKKPTIPVEKPATTVEKPATTVEKPDIPVEKPATKVEKPDIPVEKPATKVEKPDTPVEKPATSIEKPITTDEKPINDAKPVVNNNTTNNTVKTNNIVSNDNQNNGVAQNNAVNNNVAQNNAVNNNAVKNNAVNNNAVKNNAVNNNAAQNNSINNNTVNSPVVNGNNTVNNNVVNQSTVQPSNAKTVPVNSVPVNSTPIKPTNIEKDNKDDNGDGNNSTIITGVAITGSVAGAGAIFLLVKKNPKQYQNLKRSITKKASSVKRSASSVGRKFSTKKTRPVEPNYADTNKYRYEFTQKIGY